MSSARPDVPSGAPRRGPQERAQVVVLRSSTAAKESGVRVAIHHVGGGLIEATPWADHRLYLHLGDPTPTLCGGYGEARRRVAERGDVDVIPSGEAPFWVDEAPALSLQMALAPVLIERVGREIGRRLPELRPKGPLRDASIETIGWAFKAELDAGEPNGRLYAEHLGMALAARLLVVFGEEAIQPRRVAALSRRRLTRVFDFIEAHLDEELPLDRIAEVACLSPPHFKAAFRQTVGAPPHQYVVRRRVERARRLLAEGRLSVSEVALEVGFAHTSHLAKWTRRLLGATPRELAA